MHAFVKRFSTTSPESEFRGARGLFTGEGDFTTSDSARGSQAGLGNLRDGIPTFAIPQVAGPSAFLRLHTNDAADPNCRIKINHGTTTLAFYVQGGVIFAVDSRATAGGHVASGTVKKVIEINPYLLGTAADCQYWETYLGMHCRLHELRNGERISVAAASKYLSNLVYSYKGMGLGMSPSVYYVDSDGSRLKGELFSVGSGSTRAYGVFNQGYRWDLTAPEAYELARRSIYAAGHRDAYGGNSCNLYHIKESRWRFIGNYDISTMHYEGSGDVPGSADIAYGYDIRVAGRSSTDAQEPAPIA
ncbi:nucleophile aminohydrolase [Mycena capillaripes]|nr:nucleophile aminohydrolase [Mycena capillaripes]